jgi:hypothetical protein
MDIPPRLRDAHTLVPNHPLLNHLGCVALRAGLGLWTVRHGLPPLAALAIAAFFALSWVFKPPSWKVYLRTVLVYLLVAFPPTPKEVAGTLIIVDALMGLQSRHTATLFT